MKKVLITAGLTALAMVSVVSAQGFSFNNNLTVGRSGIDVSMLQTALINAGFSIPAIVSGGVPKGFFGAQTRAAVRLYQASRGIPNTGFVGPLTRAALNRNAISLVANGTIPVVCPAGFYCTLKATTTPASGGGGGSSRSSSGGGSSSSSNTNIPPADTSAPTITGLGISNITSSGAKISWSTSENTNAVVDVGLSTSYGTVYSGSAAYEKVHNVVLTGLQAAKTYYYRAKSQDMAGNTGTVTGSFTTSAANVVSGPTMINVGANTITNTSAQIGWTTGEAASMKVEIGLTTSYGTTVADYPLPLVTGHSAAVSNLQPGTTYYYRVTSVNAAGNSSVATGSFTTTGTAAGDTTAPVIANWAESHGTTWIVLQWTTVELSNTNVTYRAPSAAFQTYTDTTPDNVHYVTITGLLPDTWYETSSFSIDAAGNRSANFNQAIKTDVVQGTTPPATPTPTPTP